MNSTSPTNDCQLRQEASAAQRQRLLERLQRGPISTFEARDELQMGHPAGRICELRKQGCLIETHFSKEYTTEGSVARVAKYVLVKEVAGDE